MQKRRRLILEEDEDEDYEYGNMQSVGVESDDDDDDDEGVKKSKPIGNVVRVSRSGGKMLNHHRAFEYDNNCYELEDRVLISHDESLKPHVAIIKDITHNIVNGKVMLNVQRFYRPEEAEKKGGGSWEACDTRELFYSFHHMDCNASCVMHTCVVNFIPLHKPLPNRLQFPGFIVQKVYDAELKDIFVLTDKRYHDTKREELDLLLKETMARIEALPDLDVDNTPSLEMEELANENVFTSGGNLSTMDRSKKDKVASKYRSILSRFHALTRDSTRDKCLELLLESIENVCSSLAAMQKEKVARHGGGSKHLNVQRYGRTIGSHEAEDPLIWPDSAVSAVAALERASNREFSRSDVKYKQKMRQLTSNLKNSPLLAERLLKKELKTSVILHMSPDELKEGLTSEEIARNKPEKSGQVPIQITDAKCIICSGRESMVLNIITGGRTLRYELQCIPCGHTWYISQEQFATLNSISRASLTNP